MNEDTKPIPPQLSDKLTVVIDVLRTMREEDLERLPRIIGLEKRYRVQLRKLLPVEPKEERRADE